MTGASNEPPAVLDARARAERRGFDLSSEPEVGRHLAAIAAAVPASGRILELGTGAGVGLAWIAAGLGTRTDVTVVTVDVDADLVADTRSAGWPAFIEFVIDDGAGAAARHAPFDLVFADAVSGKLTGLDVTIASLRAGGTLLVDDMDPAGHDDPDLIAALDGVRRALLDHPDLDATELAIGSGIIVATRR